MHRRRLHNASPSVVARSPKRTLSVLVMESHESLVRNDDGPAPHTTSALHAQQGLEVLTATRRHLLHEAFQQNMEHVQTFWGLYHVITVVCGMPIAPSDLESLLLGRARHSPSPTPTASSEGADPSTVHVQQVLQALSEDTFVWIATELMHRMSSRNEALDDRALITAALFGADPQEEGATARCPTVPQHNHGALDVMQSIVQHAVLRLRDAKNQYEPLAEKDGRPAGGLVYRHDDVDLIWDHLFDGRTGGTRRNPAADAATFDAAFAKLPKELRDLMVAQAQLEVTSDDGSAVGRGGSLYERQRSMTLTRLASRGSVRKQYMHQLDFSKYDADEDAIATSASVVLDEESACEDDVIGTPAGNAHGSTVTAAAVDEAPPQTPVADPFADLESTREACQRLLNEGGVLSEDEQSAYELRRRSVKEEGASALVNFQSSVALFENRRRTTRLASLRQQCIAVSSNASAFDTAEVLTSVDRDECEYPLDDEELVPRNEVAGDEERDQGQITDAMEEQAGGTTASNGAGRAALQEELTSVGSQARGGSGLSVVRRLSSANALALRSLCPPRTNSAVRTTSQNDGKCTRRGRSAAPVRAPTRRAASVLTAGEKELLHCKRLSATALKRECLHLPDTVLRLLPAEASKSVLRIRGDGTRSASLSSSRRTSLGAPHAPLRSRTGSSIDVFASAPATRAATPLWGTGRSMLSTLPTIALTFDTTPCNSCRGTASPGTANLGGLAGGGVGGFLHVEESRRPGTAPRKLTPRPYMASPGLSPRSDTTACCCSIASGRSTPTPPVAAQQRQRLCSIGVVQSSLPSNGPQGALTHTSNWDRWMLGGRPL